MFGASLAAVLAAAGSTLGYDYQAYLQAGQRLLHDEPLYDPAVNFAGGFAIYLYPPPFALAMVPLAILPESAGLWAWVGLLAAAFLVGVAILPVRREVRWAIVLLAGLQWPFLYTMKLGQVTPVLFLTFAAGWRWMGRPRTLGTSIAVGTAIKLQPALLFVWAAVTGRRRATLIGLGGLLALALGATLVTGPGAWADYGALLRRVSTPITTPHNFAPGAIAYQYGATDGAANLVQLASLAAVAIVTVFAWLRRDAETSYVVTVVASQLASPLLWDHYAMLLLIPVALLLERRHWWALLIPLAGWLPAWSYPITFFVALIGLLVDGERSRVVRRDRAREAP